MRIAVLDDYQDAFRRSDGFGRLGEHEVVVFTDTVHDPVALARRLDGFEALVLIQQRSALPASVVNGCPALRFVSQTGRNTSHLDLPACAARGVTVSAGGAGDPHAVAEFAWALILAALRHIPEEVASLKAGRWQSTLGTQLRGKTLGVYAFGRLGSIVAGYGRAFGMDVVCLGRERSAEAARAAGFAVADSREAFFAGCDVISLHLPLNDGTRGIVTARDLATMKPTALLANTSRAPVIEAGALAEALRHGRPGRAAVDVFELEPVLGAADPLLHLPNALCTPHLGYVAAEIYAALFGAAVDALVAFAEGRPINVVTADTP